jgi:hypothetical protein
LFHDHGDDGFVHPVQLYVGAHNHGDDGFVHPVQLQLALTANVL